ncbi:MAG: tetratricopeptide repeat protein, partial [Mesorhizobium sp.]
DAAAAKASYKSTTADAAAVDDDTKSGIALYNKGQYDLAIAKFDHAIALDPHNAEAFGYRGLAWGQKDNYDRAITDYGSAIAIEPKNSSYYSA